MLDRLLWMTVAVVLCGVAPASRAASDERAAEQVAKTAAEEGARDAVEAFHATLVEVMQSGLEFEGRYERLSPALSAAFDVRTIARLSLGSRQWRDLEERDQQRFVDTLFDLVVATYAARFKSYAGQQFVSLSVSSRKKGQVVVKTQIVRKNGDPVRLDYYLRSSNELSRVFNIVADGVSDLSLRRADYSAIIERDGFEGLLASLADNIDQYARDDEDG